MMDSAILEGREYFEKQEKEISNKYMSANGQGGIGNTVKQAGLGAGLFTMAIVIGGLIYLANRIGK